MNSRWAPMILLQAQVDPPQIHLDLLCIQLSLDRIQVALCCIHPGLLQIQRAALRFQITRATPGIRRRAATVPQLKTSAPRVAAIPLSRPGSAAPTSPSCSQLTKA